jgi:hypothetical protein
MRIPTVKRSAASGLTGPCGWRIARVPIFIDERRRPGVLRQAEKSETDYSDKKYFFRHNFQILIIKLSI